MLYLYGILIAILSLYLALRFDFFGSFSFFFGRVWINRYFNKHRTLGHLLFGIEYKNSDEWKTDRKSTKLIFSMTLLKRFNLDFPVGDNDFIKSLYDINDNKVHFF